MSDTTSRAQLDSLLAAPASTPQPFTSTPLVLYGAGGKGRATLSLLRDAGCDVRAMIDRQGTGLCEGIPILAPDDPTVAEIARDGATAIVTVFNPDVDPLSIHRLLLELGFPRVVGMAELRQSVAVPDTYWLAASQEMTPPAERAVWLFEALSDEMSRRTLYDAVGLRRTLAPEWLRFPRSHDQYSPAGVPLPRSAVRLIDAGAYDGDTIAHLATLGLCFDAIAAFEPDPVNYSALCHRMMALDPCSEVSLWPCGLHDDTRQLRFRVDGAASSGLAATGEMLIQTVAIDTALPRFRPTYVKLDIEGAEAAALRGMAQTIETSRPALAVCVYHKPSDLWEIPLLVAQLLPDSDFYLRSHAWNGFDLVLYAVPREMANP